MDKRLYHITFREALGSALSDGYFWGKSLYKISLKTNQTISPLSLTEDVRLKTATDYFNNRNILVRFSKDIFKLDSVQKINYNAKELFKTDAGQSMLIYIIGKDGKELLLDAYNKIFSGVSEDKALLEIQNRLNELKHEAEWIATTKVSMDYLDFVQFYVKDNTKSEKEHISQLIDNLPSHTKYAVIDRKDNIIASTKRGKQNLLT